MANPEHLGIPKRGVKNQIKWRIHFCASVFWHQLKKSTLFKVLTALSVISTFLTFVGLFVSIQVPYPKLSVRGWIEVAIVIVIVLLLLMIEALDRHYFTILTENSAKLNQVQVFSQLLGRGILLQLLHNSNDLTKGNPPILPGLGGPPPDQAYTSMWSELGRWMTDVEREVRTLGQEVWIRYLDGNLFQPPKEKNGFLQWVNAQNVKLGKITEDLREGRPPLAERSASTN